MANPLDHLELARIIAGIACRTRDPDTGGELVRLTDQLLTAAGLPPEPQDTGKVYLTDDPSSC